MNYKPLGKITLSATGLRIMANALQKNYKTKGDVKVEAFVDYYLKDKMKTIGVIIKKRDKK